MRIPAFVCTLLVGAAEEASVPLGTNALLALEVAPRATVLQRLTALMRAGVVQQGTPAPRRTPPRARARRRCETRVRRARALVT